MEWIAIAALVGVILLLIVVYNRLVGLRQRTRQSFSDIDVQLKQRADLVPNLVAAVKGYAAHERETLDAVTEARVRTTMAGTPKDAAAADAAMTGALGRLIAVAESYPDLKASANFVALQSELSDVENKIAASRRFLNLSVAEYNAATEQFPAVLIAKPLGFASADMYAVSADERRTLETAPTVAF